MRRAVEHGCGAACGIERVDPLEESAPEQCAVAHRQSTWEIRTLQEVHGRRQPVPATGQV